MKAVLFCVIASLIALCSAQNCTETEMLDCTGACVPTNFYQDLVCDSGNPLGSLNCYLFGCDGGDCQPNKCERSCPVDQIVDCLGNCVDQILLGDGTCHNNATARFDCAKYNCDNGDCINMGCTPCPPPSIPDCNGNCGFAHHIGDGICHNGTENWNCSASMSDSYDCVLCPPNQRADCTGACISLATIEASKGDGSCDARFNCAYFAWDGQDCDVTCQQNEVKACDGTCQPTSQWGDGNCQNPFYCAAFNFDNGDCSFCAPTEIPDCFGVCAPASFYGDIFCDPRLNCSRYNYDNYTCTQTAPVTTGDNNGACQPTYVRDCNNVCQPQSFIGDGQCDDGRFGAVFNCALFTCDGGDCTCIGTSGQHTTGRFTTGWAPFTTGSLTSASITSGVPAVTTAQGQSTTGASTGAEIGEESSSEVTGLRTGAVAGIVIGVIVGAIILGLIIAFVVLARRPSKYKLRAAEDHSENGNVELDDHNRVTHLDKRGADSDSE